MTTPSNGPRSEPPAAPAAPPWKGAQALRQVHALNERCLEILSRLASVERSRHPVELLGAHRALWRTLEGAARKRAARCPFLLLDVNFQREEWWHWAKDPRSRHRRSVAARASFPVTAAGELMRETLMLAWSAANADRRTANLLLGMAPGVSALLAELDPHDVERIAARHHRHLQPRWAELPTFWRELLTAARDANEDALYELHLYGTQLLASELMAIADRSGAP